MEQANKELSRSVRSNMPLSILLLDIDFFKKINDTYGHQIGDTAIIELTKISQNTIREIDVAGRIGGEEFAILLPATDSGEAVAVAERLRKSVANMQLTITTGLSIDFTISIGVATLNNKKINIDSLLHQADIALYEAKNTGRNKVCIFKD
jgi:diguanylate cyclase (GGDEF)-like protein